MDGIWSKDERTLSLLPFQEKEDSSEIKFYRYRQEFKRILAYNFLSKQELESTASYFGMLENNLEYLNTVGKIWYMNFRE